jgi:hypothetical protein
MVGRRGNQRKGNKPKRRAAGRKPANGGMISHPPPIRSYGITREVRLRYLSSAAFVGVITFQNLLDSILIGTSVTTLADLFNAVRVNSVELWSLPAIGGASTVILMYSGAVVGASGDQKTHTDTSMGIEPAHVKARPDRLTQAGQFQPSSADTAFQLDIPTGTVIDVSLTLRNPVDGVGAAAAQNVGVGVTTGLLYYRGLDGKAAGATQLAVQGAQSTV